MATALFKAMDENLRRGHAAYVQVLRQAKQQIKENRPEDAAVSEKIAALLLAAEYEARLHWLIEHPNSRLSDAEIREVRKTSGTAPKWDALLRAAWARRVSDQSHSSIKMADIPAVLNDADRQRYRLIKETSSRHLAQLIDLRNSLAHGEWETALNRNANGFNEKRTTNLRRMTLYRVVISSNLLGHLWKLHYDALVTREAFERDFDKHFQGILNASRRLQKGDEDRWADIIRVRYVNGRKSSGESELAPNWALER